MKLRRRHVQLESIISRFPGADEVVVVQEVDTIAYVRTAKAHLIHPDEIRRFVLTHAPSLAGAITCLVTPDPLPSHARLDSDASPAARHSSPRAAPADGGDMSGTDAAPTRRRPRWPQYHC
jgi:hypothetical protein